MYLFWNFEVIWSPLLPAVPACHCSLSRALKSIQNQWSASHTWCVLVEACGWRSPRVPPSGCFTLKRWSFCRKSTSQSAQRWLTQVHTTCLASLLFNTCYTLFLALFTHKFLFSVCNHVTYSFSSRIRISLSHKNMPPEAPAFRTCPYNGIEVAVINPNRIRTP